MGRSLTIFIHDKAPAEIEAGVVQIFEAWGFTQASDEEKGRYAVHPQIFNLLREGLLPRAFLISPQNEGWCFIFPSYEVWLTEAMDSCCLLAERLNCSVLLLLEDAGYGWGYFLYHQGSLIDKFHSNPTSPSLYEKTLNPPAQYLSEEYHVINSTSELVREYAGNSELIAKTFSVHKGKLADYLFMTIGNDRLINNKMIDFAVKGLGIPAGWSLLYYYDVYYGDLKNADQWLNLVFMRKMTSAEIAWYKNVDADFPSASPPLWLAE